MDHLPGFLISWLSFFSLSSSGTGRSKEETKENEIPGPERVMGPFSHPHWVKVPRDSAQGHLVTKEVDDDYCESWIWGTEGACGIAVGPPEMAYFPCLSRPDQVPLPQRSSCCLPGSRILTPCCGVSVTVCLLSPRVNPLQRAVLESEGLTPPMTTSGDTCLGQVNTVLSHH